RPHQVERATAALAFLMKTAIADHQELARRAGLSELMRKTGAYYLFDRDAAFDAAKAEWAERFRHGVEVQERSVAEMRALIPELTGRFKRALFAPDYWTVSSPAEILAGLRRSVQLGGGTIESAAVQRVEPSADGIRVELEAGPPRHFNQV